MSAEPSIGEDDLAAACESAPNAQSAKVGEEVAGVAAKVDELAAGD